MSDTIDSPTPPSSDALAGREVLVVVCGGIAAYKTCSVVSELAQRGAGVTVAMTEAATQFVSPMTFQALSGRKVFTKLWSAHDSADIQHIHLTERLDVALVAPATANMIAKMANGLADDLASTLLISTTCPMLVAPAMNDRMWANAAVQRNILTLAEFGREIIGPAEGWLACRSVGKGRMVESDVLVAAVAKHLVDVN